MAQYGLDNFLYDLEVKDGNASFHFVDPNDASNTADVTISQKDFPEGAPGADDRRVADLAYSQVSKKLNDARDGRVAKDEADAAASKAEEDKRSREAAQDFFDKSQDVAVAPAKVDKDGTSVYNTASAETAEEKSAKK